MPRLGRIVPSQVGDLASPEATDLPRTRLGGLRER